MISCNIDNIDVTNFPIFRSMIKLNIIMIVQTEVTI